MKRTNGFSYTIRLAYGTVTLALIGVCLAYAAAPAMSQEASAASTPKVSKAQKLLLQRPHLEQISSPVTLRYSFKHVDHKGKKDESYSDSIEVKVDKVRTDGAKDLSFEFFTGKRRRPYQDMTNVRSNGVVFTFLQRDIWEMSRTLGGLANYFGSKIRKSLANKAEIEDVTIDNGGKNVSAIKITVRPFVGDEKKDKLKEYENKVYEFILSSEIPGEIYILRTIVPDPKKKNDLEAPLLEEVVKFEEQIALAE